MSIGQIEYTSCSDGAEGIEGFQIRAMSAGIPEPLREAAVRDSVYEPSPDLPPHPGPDQVERFPVAFGYTVDDSGTVLYRARYAGRDFSGRWGNYLAHALVFPHGAGLRCGSPIDQWDSPVWRDASSGAGSLPALDRLPENPHAARLRAQVRAFMQDPARRQTLASLLAAVRVRMASAPDRLVLQVSCWEDAVTWVAALSRCLPRQLVDRLSFVTYTARPDSHQALLAFTTPDVYVSRYGNYSLIDLTLAGVEGTDPIGAYDQLLAGSWAGAGPEAIVAAAEKLDAVSAPGELDAFACLFALAISEVSPADPATPDPTALSLAAKGGSGQPAPPELLLRALEFGLDRAPEMVDATTLESVLTRLDRLDDVPRWAAALRRSGRPLTPAVHARYLESLSAYLAAGGSETDLWLPPPDPGATAGLARRLAHVVLTDGLPQPLLHWVGSSAARPLRADLLAEVHRQLAGRGSLTGAVELLPRTTAAFLADQDDADPWLQLVAGLALVRCGVESPVTLLTTLEASDALSPDEAGELACLLWPSHTPEPLEIQQLLHEVPHRVLTAMELPAQFVQRLAEDAAEGDLTDDHVRIARSMAKARLLAGLSVNGLQTIDAVQYYGYFKRRPTPSGASRDHAMLALRTREGVSQALAAAVHGEIAAWLLGLESGASHRGLIQDLLRDRYFAESYVQHARRQLRRARPEVVARTARVWCHAHTSDQVYTVLIDDVLPDVAARRGRRYLDRVGHCYAGDGEMSAWWRAWRGEHESSAFRSSLALAFTRRGTSRRR